MTTPRLYCDAPLAEGAEIAAQPGQAHYLGNVLRRGIGDAVWLFNGQDGEFSAEIAAIRKDRASFRLGPQRRAPAPEPDLRLVVAALKRDALDWLVEKATELGVAAIHPVFTQRSVAERVNTQRLTTIAREAAEQCERLTLLRIAEPVPLHALLDGWGAAPPLLVAAERRLAPPIAQAAAGLGLPLALLVGPEGGFTGLELDDLLRRPFVAPIALGPRILRAETAALAGLVVLQALAGDWVDRSGVLPGQLEGRHV